MHIEYWVWLTCLVGSVLYLALDSFMRGGWGREIGLKGIGEGLVALALFWAMVVQGVQIYSLGDMGLVVFSSYLLFVGSNSCGALVGYRFPLFIPMPGDE